MTRWVIVVMLCLSSLAQADGIQTKGEMFFLVPFQNGGWDQSWIGPIKRARDSKDNPTLTIYVVNADGAGTPAEIEAKLPKLVAVDGIEVGGAKPTQIVIGKGKEEKLSKVSVGYGPDATVGEATLRLIAATINGTPALVAIINFETQTNVLVGVPTTDAAKPLFESIVRGMSISRRSKPKAQALPDVRPIAPVKDLVTTGKPPKGQALGFAWCGDATITFARPLALKQIELASKAKVTVGVSLDGGDAIAKQVGRDGAEVEVARAVTTVKLSVPKNGCASAAFADREGTSFALVRGIDPAAVDALPAAITAFQNALFESAKLEAVVTFPFSVRSHVARKPTVHRDWASLAKACAKDSDACPTVGYAIGELEPTLAGDRLELRFPAGYQATEEDLWRLVWKDGAWKLAGVDFRSKPRGPEGIPQP